MFRRDEPFQEVVHKKHQVRTTFFWILLTLSVLALVIFGIAKYLAPNDLAECGAAPSQKDSCQAADVIVAVSGGDTSARAERAIELFQKGWAKKIIFSGAAADKSGPSNAEVMKNLAMERGIDETNIVIDETSETTKQNADRTEDLVMRSGVERMILVTSAYHERRAQLEFDQRFGGTIRVLAAPVLVNDNQWSKLWWLTPIGWWLATSEFIKIIGFYAGASR